MTSWRSGGLACTHACRGAVCYAVARSRRHWHSYMASCCTVRCTARWQCLCTYIQEGWRLYSSMQARSPSTKRSSARRASDAAFQPSESGAWPRSRPHKVDEGPRTAAGKLAQAQGRIQRHGRRATRLRDPAGSTVSNGKAPNGSQHCTPPPPRRRDCVARTRAAPVAPESRPAGPQCRRGRHAAGGTWPDAPSTCCTDRRRPRRKGSSEPWHAT